MMPEPLKPDLGGKDRNAKQIILKISGAWMNAGDLTPPSYNAPFAPLRG